MRAFSESLCQQLGKVTMIARTQTPEKDEYSRTRQQMTAHIDVCMGGRVAEELIFGPAQVDNPAPRKGRGFMKRALLPLLLAALACLRICSKTSRERHRCIGALTERPCKWRTEAPASCARAENLRAAQRFAAGDAGGAAQSGSVQHERGHWACLSEERSIDPPTVRPCRRCAEVRASCA